MGTKKVPISLLLPEHINEKLKELAKASHRTRSAYIRQILRRYMQYVETRDNPEAKPVDWDIDKFYLMAASANNVGDRPSAEAR